MLWYIVAGLFTPVWNWQMYFGPVFEALIPVWVIANGPHQELLKGKDTAMAG